MQIIGESVGGRNSSGSERMRILVLGGTVFLGRAIARLASQAGHQVTCAARGVSGNPVDGVRFVPVDRDDSSGLSSLAGERFDAVIDVTRRPSHARNAVAALADRVGHWSYVSSISVYADRATHGQRAAVTPLLPVPPGVDDPDKWYGECKVSCEEAVLDGVPADRAFICRAGLIIGPEDPSDRFPYWVARLAEGGDVLGPGSPEDLIQVIDVADLAQWLLDAAPTGLTGVYDGTGRPMPRGRMLAEVAAGVGNPDPRITWAEEEFLAEHDVRPWTGERSLPLWLSPQESGMMNRDVTAAFDAGLRTRPIAETAAATARWMAAGPAAVRQGGLRREEEAAVLRRWHAR